MLNLETLLPSDTCTLTALRVLLIEDNPADAYLFQAYLSGESSPSYTLTHVTMMAEVHEAMQREAPDVIVLDLTLPDAQGLAGLNRLVEMAPSTAIVVHSGLDDKHLIEEAVQQGAQDYLVKGRYDAALLKRVLRYAIERQQTLRLTQESEKRFRSIIEQTSDGVVIVCPEGKIVFANPAATTLLGSPVEALLGTLFPISLTTDAATELEITNDEGQAVTVEMQVTQILWECQNAFLASLRDITAHKALQEQLTQAKEKAEQLARLKSSFLASMSHELRTPLTGIMGFADTLINELDAGSHRDFAGIIKQAGTRLLATINSVLDLSQLEAGTVTVNKQYVRLRTIAEEVVSLLEPLADEQGLALHLEAAAPEAVVHVDPILLQRILDNLIGNALKFTKKGRVVVEIDADAAQVYLRVKDTGVGIKPSFLPYLFEEFSQENGGLRRAHPGTGLGLALTKKLVKLLEATIAVESTVGVGSTFTVTLPRVACMPMSKGGLREPVAAQRTTLLVAEDHRETQHLMKHILEPYFDVTLVADGETALDLLETTPYDALVLDVELAGSITGADVLQSARTHPRYRHTPAIAVTALDRPSNQPYFFEDMGFDGYLSKPFTRTQLLFAVRRAMKTRAYRAEQERPTWRAAS